MVELTDLKSLLEKYKESLNKGVNLDNRAVYSLIIVYAIAIVVGFFGNILIVVAVLSRRRMRTARNVFIVTLAISDLILCVFTMPSTLWEVRTGFLLLTLHVHYFHVSMNEFVESKLSFESGATRKTRNSRQ